MSALQSKDEIRERVWSLLDERGVTRFPRPTRGRIPNFEGSDKASKRVLRMPEFRGAEVVKVNPDYPQVGIRRGGAAGGETPRDAHAEAGERLPDAGPRRDP